MKPGFQPKPDFRSALSRMVSLGEDFAKYGAASLRLIGTRTIALLFYILISMLVVAFAILNTKIVQVVNGSGSRTVYTFRSNPVSILRQCGITLTKDDRYSFSNFKNNYARIDLFKAFPVQISADKAVKTILMAKGTVSDALKKAGVTLGTDDLVSESLSQEVTPDMSIKVSRVRYATVTRTEPVKKSVNTVTSILLRQGARKVLAPGRDGRISVTEKQKFIDGVLTETQVVSRTVTAQPVACQMLVGAAASTPVSQLQPSSGLSLTANGTPASFKRVIHGIATGYSPRDGTVCATGKHAKVGYVAVNPEIIPYGSRLYIMSSDGSFVYGYAIAEDTGGFVHNGSGVDVDLYFASAGQITIGRKKVDIYVLS